MGDRPGRRGFSAGGVEGGGWSLELGDGLLLIPLEYLLLT